jgi:hypothetical protein
MDAIPFLGWDGGNIQIASFELSQCRRGIEEAVFDLIDLGLRNGFVSGPEWILDQGQVGIVDPFLQGERTIALEELLLRPAIGGGFVALIAFDHPLWGGMRDPQTKQI